MSDKPLVKNAADKEQVQHAASRMKRTRDQELNDLRLVLSTLEGRRLFWRLLTHCKVYGSVWEPSAKIHYNSGMQDVGHFLMAEVVEAGDEIFSQMMKEAKNKEI